MLNIYLIHHFEAHHPIQLNFVFISLKSYIFPLHFIPSWSMLCNVCNYHFSCTWTTKKKKRTHFWIEWKQNQQHSIQRKSIVKYCRKQSYYKNFKLLSVNVITNKATLLQIKQIWKERGKRKILINSALTA